CAMPHGLIGDRPAPCNLNSPRCENASTGPPKPPKPPYWLPQPFWTGGLRGGCAGIGRTGRTGIGVAATSIKSGFAAGVSLEISRISLLRMAREKYLKHLATTMKDAAPPITQFK